MTRVRKHIELKIISSHHNTKKMSILWKKLTCSVLLVLFTNSNSKVSNARLKLSGGTNLGNKKIGKMMTNQFINKFTEIPVGLDINLLTDIWSPLETFVCRRWMAFKPITPSLIPWWAVWICQGLIPIWMRQKMCYTSVSAINKISQLTLIQLNFASIFLTVFLIK